MDDGQVIQILDLLVLAVFSTPGGSFGVGKVNGGPANPFPYVERSILIGVKRKYAPATSVKITWEQGPDCSSGLAR